jgi:mannose-6-phosphate isomerase
MALAYVEKPWGNEVIFAHTDKYVGKVLTINKGHRLSRQYHNIKDETIYVSEGTLSLELGSEDNVTEIQLDKGHAFRIEPGVVHRFCAIVDCVKIIEVSTPELNDIVRLEDNYGRVR